MTATEPTVGRVRHLDELEFTNRWTQALPADPDNGLRPRQVAEAAFTRVEPTPVASPRTLAVSSEVVELLGLDPAVVESQDFADVFAGNRVPNGADPHAQVYGGHQFGTWAGQLGDGRAISLGEVRDTNGGYQTLQLKGAGPTPYSRHADGRAVLRSSLREFLCSEAMFHLGIPTTRALSLVLTGDEVVRDIMYSGNPAPEPGAVVCRVAPSFTRFGTFQLPAARGDLKLLRQLIEVTLELDFPHLAADLGSGSEAGFEELVARWFDEVCERSANLVIDWMRVGFVHGVLNTDNMSILGLTIDYGPYGWLEDFDPTWTPNTTDAGQRRYRYGAQPQIVQWNLLQLAQAVASLTQQPAPLEASLSRFAEVYHERYLSMMANRLGWGEADPTRDAQLVESLFAALTSAEIDQVIFFRELAQVPVAETVSDDDLLAPLANAWYDPDAIVGDVRDGLVAWLRSWAERVRNGGVTDEAERRRRMDAVNPRFVLRNYLAQEAIDAAARGDYALLHELHDVLRRPYDDQPGKERFADRRPEWARHRVGSSMLSCSS